MTWKEIFEKLKKPSGKILGVLYPVTLLFCAGAITVAVLDATAVWGYPIYALAAITLFYSTYTLVRFAPTVKEWAKTTIDKWWFTKRLSEDYEFRTIAFAVFGLAFNVAYSLFLGVMGILFRSVWYGGLALYYIVLSLTRGIVLIRSHKDNQRFAGDMRSLLERRLKAYRFCGWSLLIMAQVVAVCLTQLLWSGWSFKYAGMMIFVFAFVAFVRITMAIVNMVKVTKRKGIITKAVRHINLASALVSILALQTAMFDSFGDGGDFRLANALLGVLMFLLIMALGAYTIWDANKRLKRYSKGNGSATGTKE